MEPWKKKISRHIAVLSVGMTVPLIACNLDQNQEQTVQSALTSAPGCGQVATNSVCVCTDPQFNGSCLNLTNTTRFYMDLRAFNLNDNISSIWIGPDAKARFCVDIGMGGRCISQSGFPPNGYINSDLGNGCFVGGCQCGDEFCDWCCMNNQITAIRVDNLADNCQSPASNQIALFTDINYGGDCVLLTEGNYPNPFANPTSGQTGGGYGLPNDTISSLKNGFPPKTANKSIYEDINYGGRVHFFSGGSSQPNLGDYYFDNVTSSVKVP
jgi:hypothetical protein